MKKYNKWFTLLAAGIILSGCSSESKQDTESVTSSPSGYTSNHQQVNNYEGTGIVMSITPNKKQIIIKHDVIPGFMDAMTMPFNVPDSSLLDGIHPKDSIKLFIEYDGANVTLKKLEKVR